MPQPLTMADFTEAGHLKDCEAFRSDPPQRCECARLLYDVRPHGVAIADMGPEHWLRDRARRVGA